MPLQRFCQNFIRVNLSSLAIHLKCFVQMDPFFKDTLENLSLQYRHETTNARILFQQLQYPTSLACMKSQNNHLWLSLLSAHRAWHVFSGFVIVKKPSQLSKNKALPQFHLPWQVSTIQMSMSKTFYRRRRMSKSSIGGASGRRNVTPCPMQQRTVPKLLVCSKPLNINLDSSDAREIDIGPTVTYTTETYRSLFQVISWLFPG